MNHEGTTIEPERERERESALLLHITLFLTNKIKL